VRRDIMRERKDGQRLHRPRRNEKVAGNVAA
jgi:hypothetical protein